MYIEKPWQLCSDSWSSGDFSTEWVFYADVHKVLGMVELDLASSQGTAKTSVMSHHNHEHPLGPQTLL